MIEEETREHERMWGCRKSEPDWYKRPAVPYLNTHLTDFSSFSHLGEIGGYAKMGGYFGLTHTQDAHFATAIYGPVYLKTGPIADQ